MTKHQIMVLLTGHCESATRLASDARERRLTLLERLRLKWHFRMCSWCTRAAAQVALIARVCRIVDSDSSPLPEEARQRISAAVRDLK